MLIYILLIMYYINQLYKDGSSETSKTQITIRIGKYDMNKFEKSKN